MTELDTAFRAFDTAWDRVDHDRWVYDGDSTDDSEETDADQKAELVESLRTLSNAANNLAAELNAE